MSFATASMPPQMPMMVSAGSIAPDIAIFANYVNPLCCEYHGYREFSISATISTMTQIIDGTWIKSQLTGRRGEKADLARSLGVRPDIISKIINGERSVQPEELPKLLAFFDMKLVSKGSVEDARNEIMKAVDRLNDEGLSLLQQQLAVLANTPSLSKKS